MLKKPLFISHEKSFASKAKEGFLFFEDQEVKLKYLESLIHSINHSTKTTDRLTLISYFLSLMFYFIDKKYIKFSEFFGFVQPDKDLSVSVLPICVFFLNIISMLSFYFANKTFNLMDCFFGSCYKESDIEKFYIYLLSFSSFSFVKDSSRYARYSFFHGTRNYLMICLFVIYLLGPSVLILNLLDPVFKGFNFDFSEFYAVTINGMIAFLLVACSLVAITVSDVTGSSQYSDEKKAAHQAQAATPGRPPRKGRFRIRKTPASVRPGS